MTKRYCAVFAIGILFASSLLAQQVCDSALIKSTYNSFASDQTDWRLATLVSEKDYNEIKQEAGGNAVIYGIPVGASYSDFQNNIHDKLQTHNESLSRIQIRNVLWTGLDANSPGAYHDCLIAQVFASRGLHIAVSGATKTDISIIVRWNPQGSDPGNIPLAWNWQGASASPLPKNVQQGETTVVVPRPKQERTLAVNYKGFSGSVILEPLNKLPPLPPPAPTWHAEDKDGRPYMSPDWVSPANCNGRYGRLRVDDTHRCEIDRTQVHVGGSNDPFDTWSLWMDAPQGALVTEVGCVQMGQNIIQVQGIPQGQTGLCTGLINGGVGPIRMSIKWKQLW